MGATTDKTVRKHVDSVLKMCSVIPRMALAKMDVRMVSSVINVHKVNIRISVFIQIAKIILCQVNHLLIWQLMFWFIMKMCYMTINDIKKAVLYYIIKKNTKKTKRYRISTLENCVSQTNTISFQLHTSNETKMLTTKCKLMILQSFVSFRQYFYLNKNAENITKSSITQNLETLMYTTRGVLLNVCNLFSRTSKYQFYE